MFTSAPRFTPSNWNCTPTIGAYVSLATAVNTDRPAIVDAGRGNHTDRRRCRWSTRSRRQYFHRCEIEHVTGRRSVIQRDNRSL